MNVEHLSNPVSHRTREPARASGFGGDDRSPADLRAHVRGKFIFVGDDKFYVRGVTYGPFQPEPDGCEYHDASTVEDVYYDPTRRDRRMQEFLHAAKDAGARLIAADETRLWGLAHTERHQGVVARVHDLALAQNLAELLDGISGTALLLVLDGVTDPHNLGACLRVADAAGAHAVIAPRDRAVGLNARVTEEVDRSVRGESLNVDARHVQPFLTYKLSRSVNAALTVTPLEGAVELGAG